MSNVGWTPEVNGDLCGNVCIGANEDGRLEIYTYSTTGECPILHKWQEWDSSKKSIIGFSNWAPFPASTNRTYFNNALAGNNDIFAGLTAVGGACIQIVSQGAWGIAQDVADGGWPNSISRLGTGPSDQTMVSGMARSAQGALYVFGVDQGDFNIKYAKQFDHGSGWSWNTISHPPKEGGFAVRTDDWSFRSRLARLANPTLGVGGDLDGRIEFFYGTPARIWYIAQTNSAVDKWEEGGLSQFAGYSNLADWAVIQNDPSSGGNFAGRLEVFALAQNNATGVLSLFHAWQINSNGITGWTAWQPIPGLDVSPLPTRTASKSFLKGPLRAARQQDGSITVFALGALSGQREEGLFYIQQDGPHNAFRKNWISLGGENITAFDVGQNVDGTLLVVINSGGQIFRRQQQRANSDIWTTE